MSHFRVDYSYIFALIKGENRRRFVIASKRPQLSACTVFIHQIIKNDSHMANENITFDKLTQAVGCLTEQVERIH